jgi:hypothetical protein
MEYSSTDGTVGKGNLLPLGLKMYEINKKERTIDTKETWNPWPQQELFLFGEA